MSRLWDAVAGVLFSLIIVAAADAAVLSGSITDWETGKPVSGATITAWPGPVFAESDAAGRFSIRVEGEPPYHLFVTHVGYATTDTIRVNDVASGHGLAFRLIPATHRLGSIVVTGTRSPHILKDVPVETQVITREELEATGETSVFEAAAASIGLSVDDNFQQSGITVRGVQGDRVLILVDGHRTVGRIDGRIDLEQFSLANVEQIEIVKGTGSTLYGSDAIGGVINIITRKPKAHRTEVSLSGDIGSFGTFQPVGRIAIGNGKQALAIDGAFRSTNGYDYNAATPSTEGEEAIDRWNIGANYRWQPTGGAKLEIGARFMREERRWIESVILPNRPPDTIPNNSVDANDRYELSAQLTQSLGRDVTLTTRLFGTTYDHEFAKYNVDGGEQVQLIETDDEYYEASSTLAWSPARSHLLTYGIEVSYEDFSADDLAVTARPDRSIDLFSLWEWEVTDRLTSVIGARWEEHKNYKGRVNPSLNLLYQLSNAINLRGYVGAGFRAPSQKQLYFIFDHAAQGYQVIGGALAEEMGFPGLDAEKSINSSISFEYAPTAGLQSRVTYFYNHIDNLIEFPRIDDGGVPGYPNGIYAYQNVQTALTQGIEVELRTRVAKRHSIALSYEYLDGRDLTDGRTLANRSHNTFKWRAEARPLSTDLTLTVWGQYQSSREVADPQRDNDVDIRRKIPGRTLLNASISQGLGNGVDLYLRGENLIEHLEPEYRWFDRTTITGGVRLGVDW